MPRKAKRDCEENPLETGTHSVDIKELAIFSIKAFFEDKSWFCGGPIPETELITPETIKTVLRTPNDDETFDFIHKKCLAVIPRPRQYRQTANPWTIQMLLDLLKDMRRQWLPKDFQPGLLLLYFKFCKGIQIPPPPEDIVQESHDPFSDD